VPKEIPVKKGMKPFLISERFILEKLLDKFNSELGISHIILVRNKASKEKAEKEFSKYRCPVFTIFESKVFLNLKKKNENLFNRDWNSMM